MWWCRTMWGGGWPLFGRICCNTRGAGWPRVGSRGGACCGATGPHLASSRVGRGHLRFLCEPQVPRLQQLGPLLLNERLKLTEVGGQSVASFGVFDAGQHVLPGTEGESLVLWLGETQPPHGGDCDRPLICTDAADVLEDLGQKWLQGQRGQVKRLHVGSADSSKGGLVVAQDGGKCA
eukprot:3733863-Amphidinium_carterae.1